MRRLVAMAVVAALAAPAAAQGPADATDEARERYQRGVAAYREGRWRDAIAEFQAANRLRPSPALHYDVAQARERLGEAAEALASYAEYLRLEPQAQNRSGVEKAMKALQARLATKGRQVLLVLTDPGEAEVSLDGERKGSSPFAAALAPGPHRVAVALPRFQTVTRDVTLARDRPLELHVTLPPAPAPADPVALRGTPPSPPAEATRPVPPPEEGAAQGRSWLGPAVAGGVAVAAAVTGLVFGAMARGAQDDLLGQVHDQSQADALASKARSNATTANVLYGVSGAALLTGGLLAFVF